MGLFFLLGIVSTWFEPWFDKFARSELARAQASRKGEAHGRAG